MRNSRLNTNIKSIFLLSSLISLAGLFYSCSPCAIQKGPKGNWLKYEIKKGPCFGSCPVYNLYVFADGEALLYAQNFVDDPGIFTRELSKEEYTLLCGAYKNAHWSKLKERYESNIVDLPSSQLTLYDKKGDKKTVHAQDNIPEPVIAVTNAFEKIRKDGGKWKKIFINPTTEHFDTRWLVLNLNGEDDLNTLEAKYKKYGLKRGERITPKLNYWEVTYDYTKVPGELMFYLLRKDPIVKEVAYIRANVREPKARPGKS